MNNDTASFVDLKIHGLTEDTINDLNRAVPERCPNPSDSEREIWMYAGKRELVRYLQHQYKVSQSVLHTQRLPL